jgi:hypothetical protein
MSAALAVSRAPLPEFRCEFPRWRAGLGSQDRAVLDALMVGGGTEEVARLFGLSPAGVSPLRRVFEAGWRAFHGGRRPGCGEMAPAAAGVGSVSGRAVRPTTPGGRAAGPVQKGWWRSWRPTSRPTRRVGGRVCCGWRTPPRRPGGRGRRPTSGGGPDEPTSPAETGPVPAALPPVRRSRRKRPV